METIYQIGFEKQHEQTKYALRAQSSNLSIFFGSKAGKIYAAIAEYKRRGPSRGCNGRWHGNSGVYSVYYRVNFATRNDGNAAYLRVRQLFSSCRPWFEGSTQIDCYGNVSFDQIKAALEVH